jgi:hypothetical protein
MPLLPDHASKGYFVVPDTNPNAKNFYGFTVVVATAITAIVAPTSNSPEGYDGDENGVTAIASLPPGFYPIRGSSITAATSNAIILWLE